VPSWSDEADWLVSGFDQLDELIDQLRLEA
jgi:hypothetical protein